jgi:SAM-dependent methyltransferase
LTDFLARHPIYGSVLVPGCGTGHDVRAIAGKGAAVVGLDLAESAIAIAQQLPTTGNETYELGDLFTLPTAWQDRFDWVVEHTCFCAIPPTRRADYVQAMSKTLKQGGHFFAIFFLTPDVEEGPPFGTTKEELATLFTPQFELVEVWVPSQTFAARECREVCQLMRRRLK